METFPKDDESDPGAFVNAIKQFNAGDAVTIFTPDDTHFQIALEAINAGDF